MFDTRWAYARTALITLETMADDETMYGSLGRLAPAWGSDEVLDGDEIYERFFAWVRDAKGIDPWPHMPARISTFAMMLLWKAAAMASAVTKPVPLAEAAICG